MAFRPKLIPTLFTIPALITLIGLGTWQLQRMEWKEDLIDKLQTRASAPAVPLPAGNLDIEDWEFKTVSLTGTFLHDQEIHLLNRSLNGNPGIHVIVPFRRSDVPGGEVVMVDRGWVPFELLDQASRKQGLIPGTVTVTGIIRFQRPVTSIQRVFLPENEPARNMWYSMNEAQIAKQLSLSLPNFYVVDGNDKVPGTYPLGHQWTLDVRNDHLQYAITWFLLALGLAAIYVVYHRPKK